MRSRLLAALSLLAPLVLLAGCSRTDSSAVDDAEAREAASPVFRNVAARTDYVGDSACVGCHAREAAAYAHVSMASSFHRWTAGGRIERPLDSAIVHRRSGFRYEVKERGGALWQVEYLLGPDGRRTHELARRMDWVMGSGRIARSYFTSENGRLFQLPLTWYASHGWDFSPGYEVNDARFDRLLPDRCVACHASYPVASPHLEGKYVELRPGIGCERCHGPGALHVSERRAGARAAGDSGFDRSIVNPARLPVERRLDVCEQCHVHTAVGVLREGRTAFGYVPSQPLRDQWAFFKEAGSIDVVSHADRLRQSRCFLATRATGRPLECATCHDPHRDPAAAPAPTAPCLSCHATAALAKRFASSPAAKDHQPASNCIACHMPPVKDRAVPHGSFTEHWIGVPGRDAPRAAAADSGPIEPFYARDRTGPEAAVYRGMGAVVHASLADDRRLLADAAATLQESLGEAPGRADARFLLGVAYQQLGAPGDAADALERSLAARGDQPEALRALARTYEDLGRDARAADTLYEQALALQPALAWIRAEYADLLLAQGERTRAVAAYREALAEQPSLAPAWFALGTALVAGGDRAGAARAFGEAVHLDPSLGEATQHVVAFEVRGDVREKVRVLPPVIPPAPALPRSPSSLGVEAAADGAAVVFTNVPAGTVLRLLRPDGTLLRELSPAPDGTARWDLATAAGRPVGGGVLRARVAGRAGVGRAVPPLAFGVVRGDGR